MENCDRALVTIKRVTQSARRRMREYIDANPIASRGFMLNEHDFMTPTELRDMHLAKSHLPSYGEQAQRARERIRARIKLREETMADPVWRARLQAREKATA